ncbi:MAG TPA: hypothetical protein VF650_11005 [Allosphingosinicella sp.]|jgi:hypothetical protein
MVFNMPFRFDTGNDVQMPDVPQDYELPTRVVVWRVTFDEDGGELHIFYNRSAVHDLQSNDPADFEAFLARIVDRENIGWRDPDITTPGETPLSIKYDGLAYMVFVIRDKKWRFSVSGPPFSIQNYRTDYYLHPRCAWREPGAQDITISKQADGTVDCTTAFFIADAAGDQAANGDAQGKFMSSFNIFLELSMRRKGGRRHVPIVIDPDVGYPEGTTP